MRRMVGDCSIVFGWKKLEGKSDGVDTGRRKQESLK